jgi:hypothetical protein
MNRKDSPFAQNFYIFFCTRDRVAGIEYPKEIRR